MDKLTAVNSNDRDWTNNRYVIALGAYGWTRLLVWANSLDDAIEECAEWCAKHAPGLLADEQVESELKRVYEESDKSLTEEERQQLAWEHATTDVIICDQCHYFLAWEVHLMHENPTREQLLEITGNPEKRRVARVEKAKRTGRPFPKRPNPQFRSDGNCRFCRSNPHKMSCHVGDFGIKPAK